MLWHGHLFPVLRGTATSRRMQYYVIKEVETGEPPGNCVDKCSATTSPNECHWLYKLYQLYSTLNSLEVLFSSFSVTWKTLVFKLKEHLYCSFTKPIQVYFPTCAFWRRKKKKMLKPKLRILKHNLRSAMSWLIFLQKSFRRNTEKQGQPEQSLPLTAWWAHSPAALGWNSPSLGRPRYCHVVLTKGSQMWFLPLSFMIIHWAERGQGRQGEGDGAPGVGKNIKKSKPNP